MTHYGYTQSTSNEKQRDFQEAEEQAQGLGSVPKYQIDLKAQRIDFIRRDMKIPALIHT
jgi:hypothetical protein